ncbi:MAG: uroporphyrinogen-III synthase [Alphaproteobacteria bacterium]|nr:uroporphyrinogen-III synthase [Alphaproteobacteria bacterium]
MTRPEPGSTRTARTLRARGYQTLVMPLTRTVSLAADREWIRSAPAGAYVVTSGAAIRHWSEPTPAPGQLSIPLYSVGERTAELARDCGFTDVRVGPGDAGALAEMLVLDVETGRLIVSESKPVIHMTGRVRKIDFETLMELRQIPHRLAEIYDTEEISYSTDYLLRNTMEGEPVAALLYSHYGATLLMQYVNRSAADKILNNFVFYCLSAQVATALPNRFRDQIRIAKAPTEEALLMELDRGRKAW